MNTKFLTVLTLLLPLIAQAQFDESAFKQALKVKKKVYIADGSITGGDRLSSDYHLTKMRVAPNPEGFDRFVLEFPLPRPPFFMVEADAEHHQIIVTVYGKPKLDFSRAEASAQAAKTKSIQKLEFMPVVDDTRFSFTIKTQGAVKTEVFELSEPGRIIIDLKP